jgi:DNA (cytosine-5)-methyltransferase 1
MEACALFAGIGGLELGLHRHGVRTVATCELDPHARRVLAARFPAVPQGARFEDVRAVASLPRCDVLTAGFPCTDLSMAGPRTGIQGARSGLVASLFALLRATPHPPEWLLIENVPYMLGLQRGEAMRYLTGQLEALGWRWAYRVVDARAFGVPQRRLRVLLLASPVHDPRPALLAEDVPPQVDDAPRRDVPDIGYGFYWTEGRRGLGWVIDGVPTIKAGSGWGIPSPPAVWDRSSGLIGLPHIHDLERLQGFPAGYTAPALAEPRGRGARHRLLGNAVCVPVAAWAAERMLAQPSDPVPDGRDLRADRSWPKAAWGAPGQRPQGVAVGPWPRAVPRRPLLDFLEQPLEPLSLRATTGYLGRLERADKIFIPPDFLAAVRAHQARMAAPSLPSQP